MAVALGVICFLAGGASVYVFESILPGPPPVRSVRAIESGYRFIAPLLLCSNDNYNGFRELVPLRQQLEQLTASARDDGTITSGSVYYRDLTSGSWVGIDENALYTPASLLKVPILIAYLKAAEQDPSLLQKLAYYQQEPNKAPPLVSHPLLVTGHTYSVSDLLRGMVIDSDNTAKDMLEGGMDHDFLGKVYSELDIQSPYGDPQNYQISTRTYALFFRILYNSTFLDRDMSEKALSMLADVSFDKGLRAGTPSQVPIAHKYGYAVLEREPTRIIELSDCGIIYDPGKPYALCVMAQGTDPDVTATYIRDVASTTNRFVSSGSGL